ncbi:MAG: hypothetical protein QXS02_01670 [Candidatus Thermoplasmatota archaeon]
MVECKIKENKIKCNCTYPCDKKGLCCTCLSYHRSHGELPACYFPADAERTYNRSIENYLKTRR